MRDKLPLFVINLDSSKNKMAFMKNQLECAGLNYERISAVCGADFADAELKAVYSEKDNKKHYHRDLTLGEIGCYMSHRKAWQKMVAEHIELAVIVEDDVNIESSYFALADYIEILSSYDLIKLTDNQDISPANSRPLSTTAEVVSYNRIPNCTTGYIISISGAKKMLSRKQFFRPVDIDIQFCYELNVSVVGCRPYSITENHDFASDIVTVNQGKHSNRSRLWRNVKFRAILWWYRTFYQSAILK